MDLKTTIRKLGTPVQILGWVFLSAHWWHSGVTFSTPWFLVALVLDLIIPIATMPFFIMIDAARFGTMTQPTPTDRRASRNVMKMYESAQRSPWRLALIPGKDGVFLVPLIYLGITPLLAGVAAALFALMHLPYKTAESVIVTFITRLTVVILVLPHGIEAIIAAHVLIDLIVLSLVPRVLNKKA